MDRSILHKAQANQLKKDDDRSSSSQVDYGMHILVDKDSQAAESIDIVAIHGLNGHYLNTWTDPKTGVNWLSTYIPKIVPNARVMSFWYNSMLQFSKSTMDSRAFGQQLLACLVAGRYSVEERVRPIIFLCHSLGGIVFKQAFLMAYEDNHYMDLAERISAVFFFGTPHKGSNIALWASHVAKLVKLASLGTSTNTQLSTDLEPKSRVLQYVSESFAARCAQGKLRVVSCYETDKMDFMSSSVVDKESAILGNPAERIIPVPGDHRSICRFSDFNERRFQAVRSELKIQASAAIASTTKPVDVLVRALYTSKYEVHRSRNPPAVKGTCIWIHNHPIYQSWSQSTKQALLWISADPGCGKSVLAGHLIDYFGVSGAERDTNICYFFFKADNMEQASAINGISALLHQLYKQQKELASTGILHLNDRDRQDVGKLWTAFVISCSRRDTKKTVCILDGLDECEPQSRVILLRLLSDFSAFKGSNVLKQVDTAWQYEELTTKLKIIVLSRPETQIKLAFDKQQRYREHTTGKLPSERAIIRLRGEDETDVISDDITIVIKAKIDDLIDQGLPPELLENVKMELIKRADRTFLWVSLVINLMEDKLEAGASMRGLAEILQTRDIFAIYAELLATRSNTSRARKMLTMILAATRPLTVEEVSVALAVPPMNDLMAPRATTTPLRPGNSNFDDVEYDIVFPNENHIKSLCGHFVRIIRNKLYLVHETAREFLLIQTEFEDLQDLAGSGKCTELGADLPRVYSGSPQVKGFQHSFDLLEANCILLEICVTYIYCLGKKSRCSKQGETSALTAHFLHYAAKAWVTHFHHVRQVFRASDLPYFQNLCSPLFPGFQRWIEAYWTPHAPNHPSGLTSTQVQDHYILFFGLEMSADPDDNEELEDDKLDFFVRKKPGLHNLAGLPDLSAMSSNPGSLSNYHFPLEVDANGFVALDHTWRSSQPAPNFKSSLQFRRVSVKDTGDQGGGEDRS